MNLKEYQEKWGKPTASQRAAQKAADFRNLALGFAQRISSMPCENQGPKEQALLALANMVHNFENDISEERDSRSQVMPDAVSQSMLRCAIRWLNCIYLPLEDGIVLNRGDLFMGLGGIVGVVAVGGEASCNGNYYREESLYGRFSTNTGQR